MMLYSSNQFGFNAGLSPLISNLYDHDATRVWIKVSGLISVHSEPCLVEANLCLSLRRYTDFLTKSLDQMAILLLCSQAKGALGRAIIFLTSVGAILKFGARQRGCPSGAGTFYPPKSWVAGLRYRV